MSFNHNLRAAEYVSALERELTSVTDKARKAAILAELDTVRGSAVVKTETLETRVAAPAQDAAPLADFGGK